MSEFRHTTLRKWQWDNLQSIQIPNNLLNINHYANPGADDRNLTDDDAKYMKTRIVVIIVLLTALSSRLHSQEHSNNLSIKLCKSEVDKINNMVLYKGYLIHSDDVHSIKSTINQEYEDSGWMPTCIYYDSYGRIRKYVDVNEITEGGGERVNIMYFDEAGSLCYNLYSDVDQGQMLYGKMYVCNSNVLRFEGSAYSMDYNDGEWRDFLYLDIPFPLKINEYEFSIKNVEDIKNWLKVCLMAA